MVEEWVPSIGEIVRIRSYLEDECGVLGYSDSADTGMIISAVSNIGWRRSGYEVLYRGGIQQYTHSDLVPLGREMEDIHGVFP